MQSRLRYQKATKGPKQVFLGVYSDEDGTDFDVYRTRDAAWHGLAKFALGHIDGLDDSDASEFRRLYRAKKYKEASGLYEHEGHFGLSVVTRKVIG